MHQSRHNPLKSRSPAAACHTLLVFNSGGYRVAAKLRPGNVHSADGWTRIRTMEGKGGRMGAGAIDLEPSR